MGYAQNVDCRSCHTPNATSGARDFSQIYAKPSSHHAVGIKYPAVLNAKPNFTQPNGRSTGVAFFDRDSNGQPGNDEILLFGAGDTVTVECASCHKKHGNTQAPADATRNHYLLVDNTGSALCIICHSY